MAGTQSTGKRFGVLGGAEKCAGSLNDSVPSNDKSAVDGGELLDGFVHEGVEDVPVLLFVSKKWIQDELLGVFKDVIGVAEDVEGTNSFALAAFHAQLSGDGEDSLQDLRANGGGKGKASIGDEGMKFPFYIDDQNGIEAVALGETPDATDLLIGVEDAAGQADEDGRA